MITETVALMIEIYITQVLAAVSGGRIDLHGTRVAQRWTRLAAGAPAAVGATSLTLAHGGLGWQAGQDIVVTSSTYNWQNAEVRTLTAVSPDGATLSFAAPLLYLHSALVKAYPGSSVGAVDIRAEVS